MELRIPTGWQQTSWLFTSMVAGGFELRITRNKSTYTVAISEALGLSALGLLLLLIQGWFSHPRLVDQPTTKNLLFPVIL